MARIPNTDSQGTPWSDSLKKEVWTKGRPIPNMDPAVWRHDRCGAPLNFEEYGDRDAVYGWEIDHIVPVSKGGTDSIDNLQPLHWRHNALKGDDPDWKCL